MVDEMKAYKCFKFFSICNVGKIVLVVFGCRLAANLKELVLM